MTTDDEPCVDEPVAEPSPLAVAMKAVSLADPTPASNVRVGLALLALAREERAADEAWSSARKASRAAVDAENAAENAYYAARDRLNQAMKEAGQR